MTVPHATSLSRAGSSGFAVRVRGERGGPVLATAPVPAAALRELACEVWWHGVVRRGMPHVAARDLDYAVRPVRGSEDGGGGAGGEDPCRGFVIATRGPGGAETSRVFTTLALHGIAQRAAEDLQRRGLLGEEGTFTYDLVRAGLEGDGITRIPPSSPAGGTGAPGGGRVLGRAQELPFTALPLDELRRRSTAEGPPAGEEHELFWTADALERAERIARLGEAQEPAVETGAVLLGHVAHCSGTGDAFVVVVDALEAVDAESDRFSLSFTGSTWQRLQAVVRARAAAQPGVRIVGQTHGHPFSPGEPCAVCPSTPDCPKHTAYLSDDDRRWTRAVFHGQPWQVSRMYGVDASGRARATTFGLCGGWLEERGHRVMEDADFEEIRRRARNRQRQTREPTERTQSGGRT